MATPLEIAGAYTTFSNGGTYVEPRFILAVNDAFGHLLWRSPEVTRQVLLRAGVPDGALTDIGNDVQSTYEESLAVRDWLKTNRATRLIIRTDVFHTRRVRWLFRKQLKGTGVALTVEAIPVREYTVADWWRHEQGLVAFQNEVLKSVYYHLKY